MADLTDISGLKYWWRADAGVTLSSGKVAAWEDQVTGVTVAQATASKRPVLDTGPFPEGVAAVEFSGGQGLTIADLTNANTDWTILAAYDPGDDWSTVYRYLFDSDTARMIIGAVEKVANRSGFYTSTDGWTTGDWTPGPQIMSVVADATAGTVLVRINGTEVNSGTYTATPLSGRFAIGSKSDATSSYFDGYLAHLAIWEGVLTTADLQYAEGLLAHTTGLLESLDGNHPFTAARFPFSDWGFSSGPAYQTLIERVANGQERRTRLNDQIGQPFSIGLEALDAGELKQVLGWFLAHYGQGYTFRLRDWRDFQLDREECVVSGSTVQLAKRYSAAGYSYIRPITRPVPFSVTLYDAMGEIFEGSYSIDYQTGVATFGIAPAGRVWASGEFDCLVRFADDSIGLGLEPGGLARVDEIQFQEVVR